VQSFDSCWTVGFKCNNVHKIYFFGQINGKPFFWSKKKNKIAEKLTLIKKGTYLFYFIWNGIKI
jgi:hypothetical protein